ncbi:MAG: DNA primase [bacterium]|nr:DNA primase [bacterium]MDN5835271.1 DNA primase [bacterium]
MDAKEEIRSKLNIEDVVGEYVELKRAGRNFKGLSPFTSERTPSFVVSPDKNIWHDFSSGKGGDLFSFVMAVEGLDFREAIELLARKAGVDLTKYDTASSRKIADKKKRLYEVLDLAANYYQHSMIKNNSALEYIFKSRGLTKQTVTDFKIGYAPESRDGLVTFLGKKGFTQPEIKEAGLTNQYGGDLFRGRMMVSLMDSGGRVIGFTARILKDDPNAPKYINTPQTLLYDKSRHVFGLSQAKQSIRKHDYSVVVEGNMDVVSSHQAGVNTVVATAGTALTEQHLNALVRMSGNVKFAFDGDKAGLAATERAIPIAQKAGVELKIVVLPEDAKDPDELIQKSVKLWQAAIKDAKPVVDWVISQYKLRYDIASAAGKRDFTGAALKVIRQLVDPVEIEHYQKVVAQIIDSSLETVQYKMSQTVIEKKPLKEVKAAPDEQSRDESAYQDALLAMAMLEPAVQETFLDVDTDLFIGEDRQALAEYITSNRGQLISELPVALQKYDTYVKIVLLKAETQYADWTSHDRQLEAARLLRQLVIQNKKKIQTQMTYELRLAESEHRDEDALKIRTEINKLIKEINRATR